MALRPSLICGFALAIAISAAAQARDFEMGGDNEFPNSIMAPEPAAHRPSRRGENPQTAFARLARAREIFRRAKDARESDCDARLIGFGAADAVAANAAHCAGGQLAAHDAGIAAGAGRRPSLPGLATPIPNLPHGPETFQDRASRCAHQAGLNNVPSGAMPQYMGACAM